MFKSLCQWLINDFLPCRTLNILSPVNLHVCLSYVTCIHSLLFAVSRAWHLSMTSYLRSCPNSRATSSLPGLRVRALSSWRFFSERKASLRARGTSDSVAYSLPDRPTLPPPPLALPVLPPPPLCPSQVGVVTLGSESSELWEELMVE